jgi:hypothetical protein
MVFKFAPPSITVYESETVEPEFADPKNVTEVDDSIDIIETDFNNIVQKFNRVILLIDGMFFNETTLYLIFRQCRRRNAQNSY